MRSFLPLLFIALLLTIISCSSSGDKGPLQPVDNQSRELNLGDSHVIIGCGKLIIEPGSNEILNLPNRAMESHFDVTGMLNDPKCPGSQCIHFYLWNYDPEEEEYWIDIYILNPTTLSPRDPRMIFLTSEYTPPDDFDVRNADSWITLYDDDDEPDNRNPFIALAKDEVNQRCLPPYPFWDAELLVLWINPEKDPTVDLDYIVDVSFPVHCREPYEINNIEFVEPYYKLWKNPPAFEDSCSVACDVFDWQDDVVEVSFYAPDIIGDEEWYPLTKSVDPFFPNRWQIDLEDIDTTEIGEGWYETWFRALSDEPTDEIDHIYQRFYFPLFHYDDSGSTTTSKKPAIAYLIDKTGYSDIWIKELWLDGAKYPLIDPTVHVGWGETEEYRPAIDPSGHWVVFGSNKDDQIDIWKIDINGVGPPERVTNHWADDFGPRFNPTQADEIVFYSYREESNAELYTADIDGEELGITRLTYDWAEDVDPCFSRDGNWIAFASNRAAWDNYDIYVLNYNFPNEIYRITYDPDNDVRPTWSWVTPIDVSEIAFQTDRNGDLDIYKYMWATDEIVPLVILDGDQIDPCYSPNGSSLMFASAEEDYFNLYTIPWDGNMEFLFRRTYGNIDNWSPYWGEQDS